ncbi:MAG: hypothetical protein JNM67_10545 [Bacteroidetes bacterium]|nr:hypothetical protein [Bacteroidota bacterium]
MSAQASINDIRSTLKHMESVDLMQLCLRMARYKKDNKELLAYLLYESQDEQQFIENKLEEMSVLFEELQDQGSYKLVKQIRKIGRWLSKPIKYSGLPGTQAELLIHYCLHIKPWIKKKPNLNVLQTIYMQQLKKIDAALAKLHEDLRGDYTKLRALLDS